MLQRWKKWPSVTTLFRYNIFLGFIFVLGIFAGAGVVFEKKNLVPLTVVKKGRGAGG